MNYYEQYAVGIKQTLDCLPWESIHHVVNLLHQARLAGQQVFVMGNGGSASTAWCFSTGAAVSGTRMRNAS